VNEFTFEVVRSAVAAFGVVEPVVEIGSCRYDIKGQDVDLRTLFKGKAYIGCDIAQGPGVDRIEDITKLTFQDAEAGTVLCLHILEHVWDVFAATQHLRRVVKPGGMAVIVCPWNLHLHRFPKDYWRFSDDCMKQLMGAFPWLIVGRHGYANHPLDVFGIGFNRAEFPDFDQRCAAFKETLQRDSFDPSTPLERLRMWVGAGLFRKKNFKSFHARNDLTLDLVRPGTP